VTEPITPTPIPPTAVILAVPEAEPVVARWRAAHDAAAGLGVPAHITLLYPFLPPDRIDDTVTGWLAAMFAAQAAFTLEFRACGSFPEVVYLAPEPVGVLRDLTLRIAHRWPEAPPYSGVFDEVVPHLTVAHGIDEATAAGIRADVEPRLPVRAPVREAQLLEFRDGRSTIRARFPLR